MRSLRHRLAATVAAAVVLTSALLALGVAPALAGPWQYAGSDGRSGVAVFGQKMHVAVTTPGSSIGRQNLGGPWFGLSRAGRTGITGGLLVGRTGTAGSLLAAGSIIVLIVGVIGLYSLAESSRGTPEVATVPVAVEPATRDQTASSASDSDESRKAA